MLLGRLVGNTVIVIKEGIGRGRVYCGAPSLSPHKGGDRGVLFPKKLNHKDKWTDLKANEKAKDKGKGKGKGQEKGKEKDKERERQSDKVEGRR